MSEDPTTDNGWFRCKDIYPPVDVQVLAYGEGIGRMIDGVEMDICVWDGDLLWDEGGTEMFWDTAKWTHWRYLPERPS